MESVKLIQNNKIVKNTIIVFLGTVLLTVSACIFNDEKKNKKT